MRAIGQSEDIAVGKREPRLHAQLRDSNRLVFIGLPERDSGVDERASYEPLASVTRGIDENLSECHGMNAPLITHG